MDALLFLVVVPTQKVTGKDQIPTTTTASSHTSTDCLKDDNCKLD